MLRKSLRLLLSSPLLRNKKLAFKDSKMLIHMTPRSQSSLIYGGLAIAIGAIGLQYGIKIYKSLPQEPLNSNSQEEQDSSTSASKEQEEVTTNRVSAKETPAEKESPKTDSKANESTTTNKDKSQKSFFDGWFEKSFYEGGFEDKMSRREAALILGVRETSAADRIKEAHRRILLLNHPDRGGSAYMAAKINEAKDLLLKGKQ